ncbi:MAG: hypothetical protein JST69_02780 [Bacteroidetes bacterium]|nr:hypothetical protein [Bacteroidota bacterium]
MKNNSLFRVKNLAAFAVVFFVVLASCQKDSDILSPNDTQNVNTESAAAVYTNETADIAVNAVNGTSAVQFAGARTEGFKLHNLVNWDERLQCAIVTIVSTGTRSHPHGVITINYDSLSNTCKDSHGVRRRGEIIITYDGLRWMPGSWYNVRLVNFYRNNTHVQANLTLTTQLSADSAHLQFHSVLDSGVITFANGKTITRQHDLTREWIRASLPQNDEWITLATNGQSANGTAWGTNKDGKKYTMEITKDLIVKIACRAEDVYIPVSGIKVVTIGNEQYTINYGDGDCDNTVTVTISGKQKQVTINLDGN